MVSLTFSYIAFILSHIVPLRESSSLCFDKDSAAASDNEVKPLRESQSLCFPKDSAAASDNDVKPSR